MGRVPLYVWIGFVGFGLLSFLAGAGSSGPAAFEGLACMVGMAIVALAVLGFLLSAYLLSQSAKDVARRYLGIKLQSERR